MNRLLHDFSGIVFHNDTFTENEEFSNDFPEAVIKTQQLALNFLGEKAENSRYILLLSGFITFSRKDMSAEKILNLYCDKKELLFPDIDGNFIIFVFDKEQKQLTVINSPHNSYHAYIYENENFSVIASSVKKISDLLSDRLKFNESSPDNFLSTGFNRSTQMQFKNVYRLQASHYITFDKAFPERKNYWNMPFDRKPILDTEAATNKYEELFQHSIASFLDKAKPAELGCFLSGGQDTSLTFLYSSKNHNKPVHSFTASFPYLKNNERKKAEYVSKKFGGIHHNAEITKDTLNLIPHMVKAAEEPLSGGTLAIYACTNEAARHVDTVITGDGGNSYWGEYYPVAAWNQVLSAMPLSVRRALHTTIKTVAKATNYERFAETEHVFSVFAQKDIYEDFFSRMHAYRQFNADRLNEILKPKYLNTKQSDEKYSYKIPFSRETMFDNLVEAKALYGVFQYMNPPTEKSLKSYGINFHTPYNNNELVNFINSIPQKVLNKGMLIQYLTNKARNRTIHKNLMLRHYPKKFVFSAQQCFNMPYVYLLQQKKNLPEVLLKKLIERGWYNETTLKKMFKEFSTQRISQMEGCKLKHHGYRIYSLLTFEVWAQIFMDKKTVPVLDKNHRTDMQLEDFLI